MSKKNGITEEQKSKAVAVLQKRATEKSFDKLLESRILVDLADPRVSIGFSKRCAIRAILGLPEIMEVDYGLSFDEMMVHAGIPDTCINQVMEKLGSKKIEFDHRGKVIFEYENVFFGRQLSTNTAVDLIDRNDGEWPWHPFCVAQLLVFIKQHPERFYSNFVLAVGKTVEVDNKQHIFMVGTHNKKPAFDLVLAHGHKWAQNCNFPKCRKV